MGAPQAQHTPLCFQQGFRSCQDAQAGPHSPRGRQPGSYEAVQDPADGCSGPHPKGGRLTTRCSSSTPLQAAALQAGVVWQHHGEQSTFWFYHLAWERRKQTVIAQLGTAGQPGHILLDTYASTQQAGQTLEAYFSASSPDDLFAPPETSPQAQQELLIAFYLHLTPQHRQHEEGAAGDGSISIEGLTQTLQTLPRGKSPGFDSLPFEFYQRFWDQLGPELTAVLSVAFQPGAASLPADMTEGGVPLLCKGTGTDRAQPASYRPITLPDTDYKLAIRVIASILLNHVVDSTHTGFLPQR